MAIIYKATVTPTKPELLEKVLGGSCEVLATYRFDDPEGEVGVEAFIVACDGRRRQVVLTYRGGPIEDADGHLVATMEHSVLGRRWVYDGKGDPVALGCFRRALLGEQEQAALEVWDGDRLVGSRDPTASLAAVPGAASGDVVTIVSDLDVDVPANQGPRLHATWEGGYAVVAALD